MPPGDDRGYGQWEQRLVRTHGRLSGVGVDLEIVVVTPQRLGAERRSRTGYRRWSFWILESPAPGVTHPKKPTLLCFKFELAIY